MSSKPLSPDLQRLRQDFNPQTSMNIVEQCRIVWEALQPTGDFPRSNKRLAEYLKISPNKVYKMSFIHGKMTEPTKEFFRKTTYQMNTAYTASRMSPGGQADFVKTMMGELGWESPSATPS